MRLDSKIYSSTTIDMKNFQNANLGIKHILCKCAFTT